MSRGYEGEEGVVILKLEKVLKGKEGKKRSRFNFILKPGDRITIPKRKDVVTLETANTNIKEYLESSIANENKINVAYASGKNAYFYVRTYMGGVNKEGKRSKISVIQPSGWLKKTRSLGFIHLYPKVEKGATVIVGTKPKKEKDLLAGVQGANASLSNWNYVIQETFATLTATLSVILLLRSL